MKKIFTLILSALICSSVFSQAPPVLAKWTFEGVTTTNTGTTASVSAGTPAADQGVLAAGSVFSGVHASASTVWSNPAGNGSVKSVSSNNWAPGDYYQFQLSSTGYSALSVTYDQTGSNTGPAQFKLQYSTNGTTFTDFQSYTVPSNAGVAYGWSSGTGITATTFTFDLSSVPALNNAANVYFRVTNTGTTSVNGSTVAATGTGRIDNFSVSGFTIFPLGLTSFNAALNNSTVNLSWATTNEVNTAGFEIQRSANGKDFNTISVVSAKGALLTNDYSLVDEKAFAGTNYYRLKMSDKDGSFRYSQIVTVKTKSVGVGVYPNPVKSELTIQHEAGIKGATISVVNFEGKQVLNTNVQIGAIQTSLDASKLAPGTYMVIYNNNGERTTKQFIKQ
jgi:hypothetical protein